MYPAAPEFNELRQYQKIGKVTKNVVKRYFVIKGNVMIYFKDENSDKPKKQLSLTDAVVKIEKSEDNQLLAIWTNKNFKIRATIILGNGKKFHYYS